MDAIELLSAATPGPGYRVQAIGHPVSRAADRSAGNFLVALLAMAGHDLRQPLQIITSAHDVLAGMLRGQAECEELAHAASATSQLAQMLGQLVEALHLHERPSVDLGVPVPLRPVVANLAAEFDQLACRKRVMLRVTGAYGTAVSDRLLLTGMLRNLLRNAIDYTPAGGVVHVGARRCGSELHISVRDTGIGIRANHLPNLFRAFQRGEESQSDGLGLGLFIVKRAADLLGHQLEVHSAEGKGSRFTIIAQANQSASPRPRRKIPSVEATRRVRDCHA